MQGKEARVKNADLRHPSYTVVMKKRKSASPVLNVLRFKLFSKETLSVRPNTVSGTQVVSLTSIIFITIQKKSYKITNEIRVFQLLLEHTKGWHSKQYTEAYQGGLGVEEKI